MKERLNGKPDTAALNDLGVFFAEQKNYTCSANAFATSLQADPQQKGMPQVAFMFGASLYLAGETKEAIEALQEAEKFGYRDIKLHLVLADALDNTHATADAEKEWRAALEIDPEYSEALDRLSDDMMADSDYKGVIALLDTARLAPLRTVQQCINLGTAYDKEGKLDESRRVLREALNTYPDSMPLAERLADVLTWAGERAEAEEVMKIARARQAAGGTEAH
jgi:tetratricopeptide (TPR) repeat protein